MRIKNTHKQGLTVTRIGMIYLTHSRMQTILKPSAKESNVSDLFIFTPRDAIHFQQINHDIYLQYTGKTREHQ